MKTSALLHAVAATAILRSDLAPGVVRDSIIRALYRDGADADDLTAGHTIRSPDVALAVSMRLVASSLLDIADRTARQSAPLLADRIRRAGLLCQATYRETLARALAARDLPNLEALPVLDLLALDYIPKRDSVPLAA